jgi:Fungalysin metallopeptidase (M36)/Fungalysin/Thermolysin Propeptide Motif
MRLRSAIVLLVVLAVAAQGLAAGARPSAGPAKPLTVQRATDIAVDHVHEHPAKFGVTAADVSSLLVTDAYRSDHNGLTHVYLSQVLDRLEVLGARMTISVTKDGEILHVGSRFLRDLKGHASGFARLNSSQALTVAFNNLGIARSDATVPASPHLVYQPIGSGALRLAWNLDVTETLRAHMWNYSVDAQTGQILRKIDLTDHDNTEALEEAVGRAKKGKKKKTPKPMPPTRAKDGGSYRVYQLPLESPNDGGRTLVRDPADRLASPYGWHDTNGKRGYENTTTNGNNAHAYVDPTGPAQAPALPTMDADGGEGIDFDFPLDLSMPPATYTDAAVTNLFYWNNIIHDVLYRYGFTEKAGNFQFNQYGRGGKGNDPVQAQAQDTGGANNANFGTPADGQSPRMQMYIWPGTDGGVIDGDLDSGVIIHEYGHGVSNRLTGGPSKTDCLSSHDEREGEGWSDFLAISMTALPGEKGSDPRGMGTYVLDEKSRKDAGIRITPYSTSKAINPSTYKTIATAAEPHGVGYVWATMLWEVYWNLVKKHGFNPNPYESWKTGGNNLAIQLVMDGMKIQPCEPGFVDARNAILKADVALTGGKNQCQIWAGFAKRGLGFKADQKDPASKTDGVESFKSHPKCR